MLPEGNWITRAPTLRRKPFCWPKCRMKPVMVCISIARRNTGLRQRRHLPKNARRTEKYSSIFNYPTLSWADIGVIAGWWMAQRSSIRWRYVALLMPVCQSNGENLQRREFSPASGFEACMALAQGSEAQKQMLQAPLTVSGGQP